MNSNAEASRRMFRPFSDVSRNRIPSRVMRTWKAPLFFVLSSSTLAILLSVACGGKEEPKTPGGPVASGSSTGETPPSDTSSSSSGGGTTTTSQLDASDLQGAKLQTSSRKEIETKGDSGPPRGSGSDEPGRRRDDIKTIILTHRDEARACYDKALDAHPGIEGDIQIKWTIDPDGNVTNPAVDHGKSQIHEESVGTCIIDVIKKIKFAASSKGYETHAAYPFNFHPKASQVKKKDGGA